MLSFGGRGLTGVDRDSFCTKTRILHKDPLYRWEAVSSVDCEQCTTSRYEVPAHRTQYQATNLAKVDSVCALPSRTLWRPVGPLLVSCACPAGLGCSPIPGVVAGLATHPHPRCRQPSTFTALPHTRLEAEFAPGSLDEIMQPFSFRFFPCLIL